MITPCVKPRRMTLLPIVRRRKQRHPQLLVETVAALALTLTCFAQTNRPQPVARDTNVIAVVLGRPITASETNELRGIVLVSLLEKFAKENRIEPTPEELDALVRKTDEIGKDQQIRRQQDLNRLVEELKNPSLTGSEREKKEARLERLERMLKYLAKVEKEAAEDEEQTRATKRDAARRVVQSWKINRALYQKYGGRVAFQQAGVEPLDGYRDFLKEQQRKGNFRILDKTCSASFWGYFTNDSIHSFYSKEEGAKFINTPWWMMEQAPKK